MKSIKTIFAVSLFLIALTSCTSDSLSADETLYTQDDLFATGEDGTASLDNSRD
ncbi:MAG: hypothetical protein GQ540_00300 [Lutibacter sp.]|uniref:hypothetical protein n=1 Tax=Lutibacter sp. TaxID=1925666 RepID=UPI001A0E4F2D|nr:hypothetical protein [Lutibacter sp.]NOR26950.1 hypothetical protein [Lutibacter sp.]